MSTTLSLPWLLVATPQLLDPNFKKAVVLIVEHTANGSMGFVINRPIQTSLADLVTTAPVKIPENIPAWYGGPVETGTGIILHNGIGGETLGDDQATIALSSSEETLIDLVDYSARRSEELNALKPGQADGAPQTPAAKIEALYPYRFLVGYSGWGAGQLMDEIRHGAWIQMGASQSLLFNTNWQTLWDESMGRVGVNPRTIAPVSHQYLN